MSSSFSFSECLFVAHDVDSSGIEHINRRISSVADDMRDLGIDVAWVVTLSPSIEMINNPALALYLEHVQTHAADSFLHKPGATFLTDQNHRYFSDKGKKHLIVAGYHANACTLRSIKTSLESGYHVTFLTDCTNYRSMDRERRIITLTDVFRSDYDLGERPYERLLELYPRQLTLMTHLEFFDDIRKKTGITSRLLVTAEDVSPPATPAAQKWTYTYG